MGLKNLTGKELQIEYAYKVSGRGSEHKLLQGIRGCKISWVRNTRSYMHRRHQEGAAGSNG